MKSAAFLAISLSLTAGAVQGDTPQVVTDIAPVHALVAAVMGATGTPELLVGGGSDPHSYQLRPSQASALAGADLVFWIGTEMTPWLERALEANSSARRVELLGQPATTLRSYGEGSHEQAEVDHEGHDPATEGHGEESHDGHGHGHEGADPHAWLDPDNAKNWTAVIRDALTAADPANASTYAANAAAALASIDRMDAEISTVLADATSRPIIVGHDAYGYFADHYNLTIAASIEEGDASSPGAGHVSDLARKAALQDVRCLFPEAGHDPSQVETLAADTGLALGRPLDPEGIMTPPGPDLYDALMRAIAAAIADCNAN